MGHISKAELWWIHTEELAELVVKCQIRRLLRHWQQFQITAIPCYHHYSVFNEHNSCIATKWAHLYVRIWCCQGSYLNYHIEYFSLPRLEVGHRQSPRLSSRERVPPGDWEFVPSSDASVRYSRWFPKRKAIYIKWLVPRYNPGSSWRMGDERGIAEMRQIKRNCRLCIIFFTNKRSLAFDRK